MKEKCYKDKTRPLSYIEGTTTFQRAELHPEIFMCGSFFPRSIQVTELSYQARGCNLQFLTDTITYTFSWRKMMQMYQQLHYTKLSLLNKAIILEYSTKYPPGIATFATFRYQGDCYVNKQQGNHIYFLWKRISYCQWDFIPIPAASACNERCIGLNDSMPLSREEKANQF